MSVNVFLFILNNLAVFSLIGYLHFQEALSFADLFMGYVLQKLLDLRLEFWLQVAVVIKSRHLVTGLDFSVH